MELNKKENRTFGQYIIFKCGRVFREVKVSPDGTALFYHEKSPRRRSVKKLIKRLWE